MNWRRLSLALVLLVLAAGCWWGVDRWRHRYVRSPQDLVGLLPRANGSSFYIDVQALRSAGLLAPIHLEHDYEDFQRQTGFDYSRDLKAAAGLLGTDPAFALWGHFDWSRIQKFATSHGGSCEGDLCRGASPRVPGRQFSVTRLQPDILFARVGRAAKPSLPPAVRPPGFQPAPIWVDFDPALLNSESCRADSLCSLGRPLQRAEQITLIAEQAAASYRAPMVLELHATFADANAARIAQGHLDLQTKMLQIQLARQQHSPDPSGISSMLAAGSFDVRDRHLNATWPLRSEFLAGLR